MATVTPGKTFVSGETVTPASLNAAATPTVVVADGEITTAKIVDANVTEAKLATGAVTGAAGGGKLAASAITSQTAIDSLASDDTLLIHDDSNTALRKATWSQIVSAVQPAGSVLNTAYDQLVAAQTYTVGQTLGVATTPTITSGVEILAVSSFATSADSNEVVIQVASQLATSAATSTILMLFAGNTLLATSSMRGSNDACQQKIIYKHSPGSTSPVNYTVRAAAASGNLYVNYSSTDYNTGVQLSSMLVQEIKA